MMPNEMPDPPVGMVMSPFYPYILALSGVIFLVVLGIAIRDSLRSGRWLPVLILAGAGIASLQECIYDVDASVWWAAQGEMPMYRIFNRSVPIWMALAYPWFIGGMGYWAYRRFQLGMTRATLWKLYFFGWFANLVLEVPALQLGNIYSYYGAQPLLFLKFPLWMAMTNTLMPILAGALIHALDHVLRGPRALMILGLVPAAVASAEIGSGWPVWLALNSGEGLLVTTAAALVTLGLSLMIAYLVSLKFCVAGERATATERARGTLVAARAA